MSAGAFFTSFFDEPTWERGAEYWLSGNVSRLEVRDGEISAIVRGSQPYRTWVRLRGQQREADGEVTVEDLLTHCTCPVGDFCKHAVAVLHAFAEREHLLIEPAFSDEEIDDEDAVEVSRHRAPSPILFPGGSASKPAIHRESLPRIQTLPDISSPDIAEATRWLMQLESGDEPRPSSEWLCFLLGLTEQGLWRVRPMRARRLKSGVTGVGKRFHSFDDLLRSGIAGRGDRALATLLGTLGGGQLGWSDGLLHANAGADSALVERLLATGRMCRDEPGFPPWVRGDERTVHAAWIATNLYTHRLGLVDATGHELTLIPVIPPWYVDGGTIGPLATGCTPAQLHAILSAPELSPEAQAAAGPKLARLLPDLPPPAPAPIATPTPCLHPVPIVFTGNKWPAQDVTVPALLIGFRYGEHAVSGSAQTLAKLPDGSRLVRNLSAEAGHLQTAANLGLIRAHLAKGAQCHVISPWLVYVRPDDPALALAGQALPPLDSVIAALVAAGWRFEGEGEAPRVEVVDLAGLAARITDGAGETATTGDWFELHLGCDVGGERIDLVPLLTPLLRDGPTGWASLPTVGDGEGASLLVTAGAQRVVRVPVALLRFLHERLMALYDAGVGPGGGWRIDATAGDWLDDLAKRGAQVLDDAKLRHLAERLRGLLTLEPAAVPEGFIGTLRPYQLAGLAWLQRLRELKLGGVLADDMGLGKTVQAITHLLAERAAGRLDRPALVVCPASMAGVWRDELARFAPTLRTRLLHGIGRARGDEALKDIDVAITTYGTLVRDRLEAVEFHVVIADEAQCLKNAGTKAAQAVRAVHARQRLALSGTPLENHLGELHSLVTWVAPGLLGNARDFAKRFRTPIEEGGDRDRQELLRRRLAPVLLRRTKEAVAPDLPARSDIIQRIELPPAQRALYETVRLAMDDRVRAILKAKGLKRGHIEILEALLRLRQCCCDPRLLPAKLAGSVTESGKLDALRDQLPTMVEEGRRILVFSQFTSFLDLIERDVLNAAKIPFLRLDGSTTNRGDLVKRFQAGEAPVFLLSLKAGGTGLTLTAADTVILTDPWWNPAVERQAADRAHRIGQDKPVFVYRLVAGGTIEERMRTLQERKQSLADALYDETGQNSGNLDEADLAALLAPII